MNTKDDFEDDWAHLQRKGDLKRGRGRRLDLTGRVFSRLRVLAYTGRRTKSGSALWDCVCMGEDGLSCGNHKEVSTDNLMKGKVKSCGCLFRDQIKSRQPV